MVVRVIQFNDHFVRTKGKMLQDDWVTTRIGPHPRGIVETHMNVSDARRYGHSRSEHRRNGQVLSTIWDNHHSPGRRAARASGGSITIFAGGSVLVSGIGAADLQLSLALCATAVIVIAYNTMATTDSRDAAFELVYLRFAMLFPLFIPLNRNDLLNSSIRRQSGRFWRRREYRRILPDDVLHTQGPLAR